MMIDEQREVQIVHMSYEDLAEVHQLDKLCFSAPWDLFAYYRDMGNPCAYYLVAHQGKSVIGFGGMWVVEDEAHVVTLAVRQEHRRRGIGRRLLQALLVEARRRGATTVTLEVRVHNLAAQQLYSSFGFHILAYRRGYYPDNQEDAAVMGLQL